jgi:hypothetical protein
MYKHKYEKYCNKIKQLGGGEPRFFYLSGNKKLVEIVDDGLKKAYNDCDKFQLENMIFACQFMIEGMKYRCILYKDHGIIKGDLYMLHKYRDREVPTKSDMQLYISPDGSELKLQQQSYHQQQTSMPPTRQSTQEYIPEPFLEKGSIYSK